MLVGGICSLLVIITQGNINLKRIGASWYLPKLVKVHCWLIVWPIWAVCLASAFLWWIDCLLTRQNKMTNIVTSGHNLAQLIHIYLSWWLSLTTKVKTKWWWDGQKIWIQLFLTCLTSDYITVFWNVLHVYYATCKFFFLMQDNSTGHLLNDLVTTCFFLSGKTKMISFSYDLV